MQLTPEQRRIKDAVASTNDHLVIDAKAGSGKTTALIMALEVIPAVSTLVLAFNKRIAIEMEEKLPPIPPGRAVVVKTLHSIGLATLRYHFPHLAVDDNASEDLITEASQKLITERKVGTLTMKMRKSAVRLLETLKETITDAEPSTELILRTAVDFDCFGGLDQTESVFVVDVVKLAYTNSLMFKRRRTIAYSDMVWGPVAAQLAPRGRFKAVCVDEAQDVSAPQFALVQKLVAPSGRLILVGDPLQGIYAWRGAAGHVVWEVMASTYKAINLPLTVTWRCPKAVVAEANKVFIAMGIRDRLHARPDAPEGAVRPLHFEKLAAELRGVRQSTFVLSRTNQGLLRVALELWKLGVRFSLNGGGEVINPLFWTLEKLDMSSIDAFKASAERWHKQEQARAELAQSSAWSDRAEQQYSMLLVALDYAGQPTRIAKLLRDVLGIERKTNITLSSVHKVKGLEADRVYLIKETFHRHRKPKPEWKDWRPPIPPEELHIEYVAITRAKDTLTWVELPENALTKIIRQRMNDRDELLAMDPQGQPDEDPAEHPDEDGFEGARLLAEEIYGPGTTIDFVGRVHQPGEDNTSRIVDPLKDLQRMNVTRMK